MLLAPVGGEAANSLTSVHMKWRAVEAGELRAIGAKDYRAIVSVCGGRLTQPEGHFEYRSRRAFENCLWYVSVQPSTYLELTIG